MTFFNRPRMLTTVALTKQREAQFLYDCEQLKISEPYSTFDIKGKGSYKYTHRRVVQSQFMNNS